MGGARVWWIWKDGTVAREAADRRHPYLEGGSLMEGTSRGWREGIEGARERSGGKRRDLDSLDGEEGARAVRLDNGDEGPSGYDCMNKKNRESVCCRDGVGKSNLEGRRDLKGVRELEEGASVLGLVRGSEPGTKGRKAGESET